MKKIIRFLILLLLIPITKISALNCSYSEIADLKKLATNVNVTYDYVEKNNDAVFNIVLSNLNDKFYFIDSTNYKKYKYTKDEIKISGYKSGDSIKYNFYSSQCNDEALYTLRINLPTYNKYYKDSLCKGIEDYSLCQKWSSHNLTYDKFVEKVSKYKESLNKENEKKDDEEINFTIIQIIIQFLLDYYLYFILFIVVLFIIKYIIRKKDNIYS